MITTHSSTGTGMAEGREGHIREMPCSKDKCFWELNLIAFDSHHPFVDYLYNRSENLIPSEEGRDESISKPLALISSSHFQIDYWSSRLEIMIVSQWKTSRFYRSSLWYPLWIASFLSPHYTRDHLVGEFARPWFVVNVNHKVTKQKWHVIFAGKILRFSFWPLSCHLKWCVSYINKGRDHGYSWSNVRYYSTSFPSNQPEDSHRHASRRKNASLTKSQ